MRNGTLAASLFACLLTWSTPRAATSEATSVIVDLTWKLSLDANGRVQELSTTDERVPKLHARLEKAIRGWLFSPGKVNGAPVATRTALHTRIEVKLAGGRDGFEVRLLNASTGSTYGKIRTPAYPTWAASKRIDGVVVLVASYDERGRVNDVTPYEHAVGAVKELQSTAVSAVRGWTFEPEVVGGHAIAGRALVPVCFTVAGGRSNACDWKDATGDGEIRGNQAIALDSVAGIDPDVIGVSCNRHRLQPAVNSCNWST